MQHEVFQTICYVLSFYKNVENLKKKNLVSSISVFSRKGDRNIIEVMLSWNREKLTYSS